MKYTNKEIEKLVTVADNALSWANQNNDEIIKSNLLANIKGVRRTLNTLNNATKKRPAIAIFGQSQVGKSYLVQNLTKPDDSKLLEIKVSDKGENVNFLTEMNPDGGRESTGLVTRFTSANEITDNDFPIELELFGQFDIAAILINSFWSDLKDFDDDEIHAEVEDLKEKILNFQNVSNDEITSPSEDDAFLFCNYILENFKDIFLIKELLKTGYISDIQNKIYKIPFNQRWEFLQIFWGGNKFITELFKMLSDEIGKLNFYKDLKVELGAVSPNTTTILDVERIKELFSDEKKDFIRLKLPNGEIKTCNRSVLSILTKEVQLKIANSFEEDETRQFLNSSDILDFPGSKSREKIPLKVFNENTTEQKLQVLVRGKVSYLFDTYTSNLGVSTLLYCMDDNPPEEKEAPHRLYKWVKKYIGQNIDERTQTFTKTTDLLSQNGLNPNTISPLFLVLTKFNVEINKVVTGKETSIEAHDSKWFARIQENFVNFMMRAVEDKWALNWSKEQQFFQHIFPVRDPMYSQATFSGFELSEKETEVRPERVEALKAMKISFVGSEIINNHLIDPKRTWAEISTPNSFGLNILTENLNYSAHTCVFLAKLEIEISKVKNELLSVLKPHLISGDINADLVKAKSEAARSYASVIGLANKPNGILNKMLTNLVISDTEIWNVVYDYIFLNQHNDHEDDTEIQNAVASIQDMGVNLFESITYEELIRELKNIYDGLSEEEIIEIMNDFIEVDLKTIVKSLNPKSNNSNNSSITDIVISHWMNKLTLYSLENKDVDSLTDQQREAFRSIINQIIKSKDRFALNAIINNTINDIKHGAVSSNDIDLVASCVSKILNKFTFSAGLVFADEQEKPLLKDSDRKVFSQIAQENGVKDLHFFKNKNEKTFLINWSQAIKLIYEENVRYDYGFSESFNSERNSNLEKLINILEKN